MKLGRPIGDGLQALHTCDTPACVKPDHLYEGTTEDNHNDSKERGRNHLRGAKGERNGIHKLSPEERSRRAGIAGKTRWEKERLNPVNRKLSEEHKANIGVASKLAWARRKATKDKIHEQQDHELVSRTSFG